MTGFDELWPGGPRFKQAEGAFKLSTDSVLLAAFAEGIRGKRAIDLGCGAGVLAVLLTYAGKTVEGVEIQPPSASLSRENMAANGFDPALIREGDLRLCRDFLPAGAYDLVVSNPPYFPRGGGPAAPRESRAAARDERMCTLDELCAAAKYLCRWGGSFALVHRPERLSQVFCAMSVHGLEPKRLRLVQYKADYAPSLALVEGRRGGKPGLTIEKPLILCRADGGDSDEIKKIYHRG